MARLFVRVSLRRKLKRYSAAIDFVIRIKNFGWELRVVRTSEIIAFAVSDVVSGSISTGIAAFVYRL